MATASRIYRPLFWNYLKNDPIWSKVIATLIGAGIIAVLASIWTNTWPMVLRFLSATSPIPHWLIGLAGFSVILSIAIAVLTVSAVRYTARANTLPARAIHGDESTPSPLMAITDTSPQGGALLATHALSNEPALLRDWFHYAISVANTHTILSACDLTVSLEFTDEGATSTRRRVERGLFKDDALTFPNSVCCLNAGKSIEVIVALWGPAATVQTIRTWSSATELPLGDELYPGVWWCTITASAQGTRKSERFRFKIEKNAMWRYMLPPGTPGEKG